MADMIVEYKVMPNTEAEVEYEQLEIKFQMDENLGTDTIEEQLSKLSEVGELQCTLMDRL